MRAGWRGAGLLTAGNGLTAAMLLARNLVLARLLSPADYGIAASLAVTMAMIEMMTQLGLDRMIVQDRDGDAPRLQGALQAFQALRGLAAGLLMWALAAPYAAFLGLGAEVASAYALMGLVPVLRGFVHFDIYRAQRALDYRPFVTAVALPAALSLAAIWPLVAWLGDWRALLWAVLGEQVLILALSHALAARRYALVWDRAAIGRALRFGWPLLANGALLFAVFNGEKLIVGRVLGIEELGRFALAFTLTLTPTLVLARSAQGLFLPRLSQARDAPERFARLARAAVEGGMAIGLGLALGTAFLGAPFLALVLGEGWLPVLPVLTGLAVVHALRVAKTGIAVVALSRGLSGNAAVANLPRVAGLALAWAALAQGWGIGAVIAVAAAAEALGLVLALWLLAWRAGVALRPLLPALGGFAVTLALLAVEAGRALPDPGPAGDPLWGHLHGGLAGLAVAAALTLLAMRGLRGLLARG